ncbi:MAG: S1/P1 nuclease [Bacteroidales bacterium]|nr:S1/P1 nuclease [Bacteroidales bacterium]
MKRIMLFAVLFLAGMQSVLAWGDVGHRTVVRLAERHLTEKTKQNLAAFMPGPLQDDASWMDRHRKDKEYAFTSDFHCMAMNHDGVYDPSWRIAKGGDCLTGLNFVDYTLSNMDKLNLSDSVKVFHVRLLIHILGDMHCLCHAYIMPERNHWKCTLGGEEFRYHAFIDHLPDRMYPGIDPAKIAEGLDTWRPSRIRKACKGSFIDWAQECCDRDQIIYEVNPYGTSNLDPDSVEKIRPAAEEAMQIAGYRLAMLLNKYFGK